MKKKYIEFLEIVPLRGPNIWTYRPVLEAWVDIGELEDYPSNTIPGFYERLSSWLPSLVEHRCSYEERGGFLRRLKEGTWPGHILEHVTLELQNLAGMPGGFGKARETSVRGVYKVVVRAWNEEVTRAALHTARDLVMAAIEDRPFDVAGAIDELRDMAERRCLGPSTACIVDAADDRDIPAIRLIERGNLVQLGYGAAQRRIWTAETDRTSAIAESISRDKDLTKTLLASCGVPVPEGRLVDGVDDAWEAAQDIGLPVVVKPYDGNHGRGVFTNLGSREEIEAAYKVAVDEGSGVIVERFVRGIEHRILVVGGKVVAVARGDTASVTGDGRSTISELIESQINSDPRRGNSEDYPLNVIRLDSAARLEIARQGFSADSVPPSGREVLIQRNGNVGIDATDLIHPRTARTVALAARIVGLDIAGIDLVAENISRPLDEQGGAIVEVNAGPGLLMHLKPAEGEPRPVGRAIADNLFPPGESGRIPIIGIAGSNGKTVVARLVTHLIQISGKQVGLACSDGLYFGRHQVESGDCAHWEPSHRTLMNRGIEAAVFENDSGTILREGLAYDRCQVGVVTNMDHPDHLGEHDVQDADQMFKVLRTQVDVVLPGGAAVLNARDPQVAEMAELCDGEVIFFALDPALPVLAEHLGAGKRAVFARDGRIILTADGTEHDLAALAEQPLTHGGRVPFHSENLLAGIAAAWALGISLDLIRAGIATFGLNGDDTPARFSLFERDGSTVIVDDAHNPSALAALTAALDRFPAKKRSIVFTAGIDRRDEDLRQMGRQLGAAFDAIALCDDATVHNRRPAAEMRAALRHGLDENETRARRIEETDDAGAAMKQALAQLASDALLVLVAGEGDAAPALELARQWAATPATKTI